jgi:hypothetical protein
MSQEKPEDIMKTYPSTDNNLEAYHSTFHHAVPRKAMPLFLGVSIAYHVAENCRVHAESITEGTRKPGRKRGPQHDNTRICKDLQADEWLEKPPEKAKSLQPQRKRKR